MPGKANYIVTGEYLADVYQNLVKEAELESQKEAIEKYLKTHKEYMNKDINTGMIMDAISNTADMGEKNEAMQAAIDNDQMKKLQVLAQRYKDAHTQKVREYPRIGRNDLCPCGSGKKYKNCCLASGKYENKIMKK